MSDLIIEEFNEVVENPRLNPMPQAQNVALNISLAKIFEDSKPKCVDCGKTLTGIDCADCAKQIIL